MTTYAYARVSAQDQNLNRQLDAFANYGVQPKNIYCDKKSGKTFSRESYIKLMKRIKKGDLLIITSIDRLGRNYDAIVTEWSNITNHIQADILVLDMPLLDTRAKDNTLVGKFISDIVLQILSFVAENERNNIRQRQKEGIASAKQRGVKFGRPRKTYSAEFIETVTNFKNGTLSLTEALSATKLNRSNFYYHMNKILNC